MKAKHRSLPTYTIDCLFSVCQAFVTDDFCITVLPSCRGRKIALDIIKGLCFLHSNKIAHLDLKTPNILLTDSHVAKISDVGLGKLIAGGSIIASQMGSFMWASPEQLQGLECGFSSDMFSFGTILWEICSGEQLRHRGLRRLVTPDECPYAIQDLIDRCHLPEAHRRPTAFEAHAILAR